MKPRRRRGPTAGGAGATRAAPTRLNWSSLQRVDEVGVHRVRGLHRAVDLALGLPEITGGLDVVVDLSRITLGPHDLLALLQIEQGERIEIGLHIVRGFAGGLAHDAESFCGVLLEPVEGVVVGLHELLDGRRIFVDEVLPEREAVHDQVRIFFRRDENNSIATRLRLAQPRLPRDRDLLVLEVLYRLDGVLGQDAVTTDRGVDGENFERGYPVGLSPGEGIDG